MVIPSVFDFYNMGDILYLKMVYLEKLDIMINKYVELSVVKMVYDVTKLLELMNNIRNEIDGLVANELKYVYKEILLYIKEIERKRSVDSILCFTKKI